MKRTKTALISGASKGFGRQLAISLAQEGWNLLITARNAQHLLTTKKELSKWTTTIAIAGDVRDEVHLLELAEALDMHQWKLDLVVNNASALGHSPLRPLLKHSVENLHTVFHTNLIAPISLLQKVRPQLVKGARIINISSDAAVEAYANWGAYGGSKAGLDHLSLILAKENPDFRIYAFDPGDMQTEMHQAAFPNEDISDRPLPQQIAVPAFLRLLKSDLPSGRYSIHTLKIENYEHHH